MSTFIVLPDHVYRIAFDEQILGMECRPDAPREPQKKPAFDAAAHRHFSEQVMGLEIMGAPEKATHVTPARPVSREASPVAVPVRAPAHRP
ncbi:MAG: hypothetical protein M3N08_02860 [Pseudomonadota bacterium]|nr:hypothetical protein [Pseudomonadota bacterium]